MTSMNSSGVLSSLNSTSALKISEGGVKRNANDAVAGHQVHADGKRTEGSHICLLSLSVSCGAKGYCTREEWVERVSLSSGWEEPWSCRRGRHLSWAAIKKSKHVKSFEKKKRETGSQEWKRSQACQSKQVLTNKYFCNWLVSLFCSDAFRQEKRNRGELFALHKKAN